MGLNFLNFLKISPKKIEHWKINWTCMVTVRHYSCCNFGRIKFVTTNITNQSLYFAKTQEKLDAWFNNLQVWVSTTWAAFRMTSASPGKCTATSVGEFWGEEILYVIVCNILYALWFTLNILFVPRLIWYFAAMFLSHNAKAIENSQKDFG